MTSLYLFSVVDAVQVGSNRSRCNSSKGLEVETTFLLEKEFLTCFQFLHASQSKSSLYDIHGNPFTRLFFCRLEINLQFA